MNERIKQLSEQAEKYTDDNFKGEPVWSEVYEQKFAELIVRECIEQIKTQGIGASSEDYGDYEIGFNAGLFHALRTTKEHFGVES